jgi:hypothetical protein
LKTETNSFDVILNKLGIALTVPIVGRVISLILMASFSLIFLVGSLPSYDSPDTDQQTIIIESNDINYQESIIRTIHISSPQSKANLNWFPGIYRQQSNSITLLATIIELHNPAHSDLRIPANFWHSRILFPFHSFI